MLRPALLVLALLPPVPVPAPGEGSGHAWSWWLEVQEGSRATAYVDLDCRPCSAALYLTTGSGGGYHILMRGAQNLSLGASTWFGGAAVPTIALGRGGSGPPDRVGLEDHRFTEHGQVRILLFTSAFDDVVISFENVTLLGADDAPATWWSIHDLAAAHARAAAVGADVGALATWDTPVGAAGVVTTVLSEPGLGEVVQTPGAVRACAEFLAADTCFPFYAGGPGTYRLGVVGHAAVAADWLTVAAADVDTFGLEIPAPLGG